MKLLQEPEIIVKHPKYSLMTNVKSKTLILSLLIFCFLLMLYSAETDASGFGPKNITEKIEADIRLSNHEIKVGDYERAIKTIDQILSDLSVLIEALKPLEERIEKLLENEKIVLNQTEALKGNFTEKERSKNQLRALELQIKNLVLAQRTIDFIKARSAFLSRSKSEIPQRSSDPENDVPTLNKIRKLLEEAEFFGNKAADHLENSRHAAAITKEKQSVEKLEEALSKLKKQRQDSRNDSRPTKDRKDRSRSDQKEQNRAEHEKERRDQKEQNRAEGEKKRNQAEETASLKEKNQASSKSQPADAGKKMTSREAVKQLSILRKKANDEIKRREKKYGATTTRRRIPTDKDW